MSNEVQDCALHIEYTENDINKYHQTYYVYDI